MLPMLVQLPATVIEVAFGGHPGSRSIAVAIAIHAGEHLDNISRAPETEVRLRILRVLVLGIVAGFTARSLTRRRDVGEMALAN